MPEALGLEAKDALEDKSKSLTTPLKMLHSHVCMQATTNQIHHFCNIFSMIFGSSGIFLTPDGTCDEDLALVLHNEKDKETYK